MTNFKLKENLDLSPTTATGLSVQGKNALPISGFIMPFAGPSNLIPSGWVLCDGTNGTPDLRGVYIAGNPNVAVGTRFGSNTHSHNWSLTFNTDSASTSHSHNWNYAYAAGGSGHAHNWGGNRVGGIGSDVNANYKSGTQANICDNNHSHSNNSIPLYSVTSISTHDHNHATSTFGSSASNTDAHTHTILTSATNVTSSEVTNTSVISTFYVNFIMKV